MPSHSGSNTRGEENLVFGYDLGDSILSFIGEPTTNILTNTNLDTGWSKGYNKDILVNDYPPPKGIDSQVYSFIDKDGNGNGYWYSYGDYAPQDPSTRYSISLWVRTLGDDFLLRAYTANNSELGRQYTNVITIPGDGEWHRAEFNSFITPSTTESDSLSYQFTSFPANQRVWICAPQMEANSHSTPFVIGTRSNTQGLLDLTGNSTIDLSNVSFDDNGEITFDGTDDRIIITPRKQYAITEPWTTELVFKPTVEGDNSWNGLFGGSLSQGGYWMFHSAGNLTYYEGSSTATGTKITYRPWSKSNTFTTNNYHHLTICYTPTSVITGRFDLYYNGGEKVDTFNWTFDWSYSLDMQNVGAGDGRYGTNDVHYFKQYNKTLTADEVAQNFRCVKSRFNIS
jgi:hypothetical protein